MIGIVVAAHGELAQALVTTAKLVVPQAESVMSVSVESGDSSEIFENKLDEAIDKLKSSDGVLVLTDMFGGTPSQVSMTKHNTGRVEVITGASLPMLIKALQISTQEIDLFEAGKQIKQSGTRAIVIASEVLGVPQSTNQGGKS